MRVVRTVDEMTQVALSHKVGLVPTMGAFHAGHLSIFLAARAECATVVVSLFVNPAQFGPNEDFARYPRDFERDRGICEREGADLLYAPATEVVYPQGFATSLPAARRSRHQRGRRGFPAPVCRSPRCAPESTPLVRESRQPGV